MACEVAEVSRQAFHDWRARRAAGPNQAELAEVELVELIREIHAEHDGTYGVPRMCVEMANRARRVNHKRVVRLMRAHGIVGVHKASRVRTTIPAEDHPPLPDLIGRRFGPAAPDEAWVGGVTYIATGEGWLYLASPPRLPTSALASKPSQTESVTKKNDSDTSKAEPPPAAEPTDPLETGPATTSTRAQIGRLMLGRKRRRRGVLVITQTRGRAPLPVCHPSRGPPGDLRLDQPLQPPPAALQPRLSPAR